MNSVIKKPLISLILVNYNGSLFIEKCLESIKNQVYDNIELIIVDNASSDNSLSKIDKITKDYILIKNEKNLGTSKAYNIGAEKAKGKYLFFLNIDIKLEKNCVSKLVNICEEDEKIGVCACKELSYEGDEFHHCGVGMDVFGYTYPGRLGKIFFTPSSAFFTRKDLFLYINGFDDSYFMYRDDLDYCWRTHLVSYKVKQVPSAIIYHKAGGVSRGRKKKILSPRKQKGQKFILSLKRRYLGERNNLITLIKNYKLISLLWVLPIYFVINIFEVIFFLFLGKFEVIYHAYIKAYLYIFKNLRDILLKRKDIQKKRNIQDREVLRKMEKKIGKLHALFETGIPKVE